MSALVTGFLDDLNEIVPGDDESVLGHLISAWRERVGMEGVRQCIHDWLERSADGGRSSNKCARDHDALRVASLYGTYRR